MNWYKQQKKKNNGAGILFLNSGMVLLGLRNKNINNANTWSIPGGKISKKDKSFWDTARRECIEEVGFFPEFFKKNCVLSNKNDQGRIYITYVINVDDNFKDLLNSNFKKNDEFEKISWFDLYDLPKNIHPKTNLVIDKYRSTVCRPKSSVYRV